MKNIFVTGGGGFIGSSFIREILDKNYGIINLDLITYAASKRTLKEFESNKNYTFIKGDIGDIKKTKLIFLKYKPECIINFAAETHVDRSIDSPKNFIESNILGVFNLLECLRKYYKKNKKIRLIHISTDEVFGDILKGRSKETDSYNPSSPYSATKASSDHLVYSYVKTFKIPAIITNCSNNYGPKQHPEKLIPKLIYNILNNKSLPIYGFGKNSREWIYVRDHCEALIKIFKNGKLGNFYNIGSNYNINNIEVVKKLLSIVKSKKKIGKNVKIKFVKDRPGHDIRYAIDSNKTKKQLKWKPKVSFVNGLEETFMWYFKNQKYFLKFSKRDITSRLGINK